MQHAHCNGQTPSTCLRERPAGNRRARIAQQSVSPTATRSCPPLEAPRYTVSDDPLLWRRGLHVMIHALRHSVRATHHVLRQAHRAVVTVRPWFHAGRTAFHSARFFTKAALKGIRFLTQKVEEASPASKDNLSPFLIPSP